MFCLVRILLSILAIRQEAGIWVAVVLSTLWWVLCSINTVSPFIWRTHSEWDCHIDIRLSPGPRPISTAIVDSLRCSCDLTGRWRWDGSVVAWGGLEGGSLRSADHQKILGTLESLLSLSYPAAAFLPPACHRKAASQPPKGPGRPLIDDRLL